MIISVIKVALSSVYGVQVMIDKELSGYYVADEAYQEHIEEC